MRPYNSPYGEVMQRPVNGATASAYLVSAGRWQAAPRWLFWEPKLAARDPTI